MKFKTEFLAYFPELKPNSRNQGGGFQLTWDIPEVEYEKIKELLDPNLKSYEFTIKVKGKKLQ